MLFKPVHFLHRRVDCFISTRPCVGHRKMQSESGISLLELMLVVAIIAILGSITVPLYQGYMDTARRALMTDNMQTIRLLEEGLRLSGGSYQAGTHDPDKPEDADGLSARIGWSPARVGGEITYVVDDVSATSFRITATHRDGTVVQKIYSR